MEAMSVASSCAPRARYAPLPSSAGAASLGVGGKEIGHRQLRTFYKQKYGGGSTALGVAHPQLHALMLQYAQAGVLSTHLANPLLARKAQHSERSYAVLRRAGKAYVKQGLTNNSTANGMKHYKNQSLNY
jgi:hypothetical protein